MCRTDDVTIYDESLMPTSIYVVSRRRLMTSQPDPGLQQPSSPAAQGLRRGIFEPLALVSFRVPGAVFVDD